ncbi:MAG: hypothetical protein CMP76_11525 [Flavobacterium sp.]|uniref:hypothetical protein n=1 Tax=unclassified Flavobacterium TaxID=196869 RepID=UPI000C540A42|nr:MULTISPECIES: hypothetical protein [unclassified Flavobacterium]MBF03914.1 hypothetical protein [Flavobacterium sp.]MCO6163941.1 hypothetical protein [Flavobacterium sp. NRK F7]|tara:strand:- start:380 stop:682 length:303 start_codon:yes stop_codon:yes gene_type:complete
MAEEAQIITKPKASSKKSKLLLSILFDVIGMLSYIVPLFAEITDVIWAPISGLLLLYMYKGMTGKVAGIIGFIEEAFPFIDFIPTFTITWIYQYVIKKEE